MGSVFKQKGTRPVPAGAEVVAKGGGRVARWRVRGKLRTAAVTTQPGGGDRVLTEARTYSAKYRDHTGKVVTRATGCRDEQAARQMLTRWEREVEQIRSGTLDAKELDSARRAAAPLETHLAAYEQSLVAAEVSATYKANVLRAVRRVAADCGFATAAAIKCESVEAWLAARIGEGMSARSRNH